MKKIVEWIEDLFGYIFCALDPRPMMATIAIVIFIIVFGINIIKDML